MSEATRTLELVMQKPLHAAPPRRRFIQLAGGGVVLAALPLAGCSTTYPDSAVRAWQGPDESVDKADVRRWMLGHGLLAPNPHNRQPWIADLRTPGEITLICDGNRLLPETDPFGRQILVGCGAFVELAVIAAAQQGYRVRVEPFPDGEPGPQRLPGGRIVARLLVDKDAAVGKDALFAQIRRRHTNKGSFDSARVVPDAVWQSLKTAAVEKGLLAGNVVDPAAMATMRQITRESFETEILTPRTYLESANLMRIGPDEVEKNRDGIPLMGSMVRLMSSVGLFDRFEVPQRGSANYKQTMERWAAFETGSGYFWIASRDNTRSTQLGAGRAYVRAHLQATAAGVDMHPLSQAVQEFAEVKPHYEALRKLLGFVGTPNTVQMLVRVGFGVTAAGPSPRRDLGQLIRT
jgi:hypothetical protein